MFYVKKKIEESVLLFWESVLVIHLRDSFVPTESFVNRTCLQRHLPTMMADAVVAKRFISIIRKTFGKYNIIYSPCMHTPMYALSALFKK